MEHRIDLKSQMSIIHDEEEIAGPNEDLKIMDMQRRSTMRSTLNDNNCETEKMEVSELEKSPVDVSILSKVPKPPSTSKGSIVTENSGERAMSINDN